MTYINIKEVIKKNIWYNKRKEYKFLIEEKNIDKFEKYLFQNWFFLVVDDNNNKRSNKKKYMI